jgi:hypothetical protein
MTECYSIVEDRDGQAPRVLFEVEESRDAEMLVDDLRRRQHRVRLVRGRARGPIITEPREYRP